MTRLGSSGIDGRVLSLLEDAGLPQSRISPGISVRLNGSDPVHHTRVRVAEAAATAIAALATVAATSWADATGEDQDINVDVLRAGASQVSFLLQRLDGPPLTRMGDWSPATNIFATADGRHIHLHGGFPHLARGTYEVLDAGPDRADLARAVEKWDAFELEEALAAEGMCGAVVRSSDEWMEVEQASAIAPLGRVSVERIADGDPLPVTDGRRPFGKARVLDLTRLLAGPTAGRSLAEHGADVMLINAPHLDNIDPFLIDTGHGKRSAHLDLNRTDDAKKLRTLVADADVFIQGYRGGSLDRRGFGAEDLADSHPGLVHVSVNCYGDVGPWRDRPGWEQMAQSATGLCHLHSGPQTPALIPAAVCDYTTGFLAAVGAAVALYRRSVEGGSYRVRASLCQTAQWMTSLANGVDVSDVPDIWSLVDKLGATTQGPYGTLRHLPPVADMTATPPEWVRPPAPPGTHEPRWEDV